MTALRRGACPTLRKPMETGDGLLARLHPKDRRLSSAQLAGLCCIAERFGNGLLEITGRGSLQVRGLAPERVEAFALAVEGLGVVEEASPVEVSPLAGLDVLEAIDPRPLAEAIRMGAAPLSERLAPKVSMTIDGGGAIPLSRLSADLRLARSAEGWVLVVAGRSFGTFGEGEAARDALRVLSALAERGPLARGRDLDIGRFGFPETPVPFERSPVPPVGRFGLKGGADAFGFVLAFGLAEAWQFKSIAEALGATGEIRLAPGYGFLALGADETRLLETGERAGFICRADDPRLRISACAGAPACRSGRLAAREIGERLARSMPGLDQRVHVSGCEKECARPLVAHVELVGTRDGCDIREQRMKASPPLRERLLRLARDADERNRECR